MNALQTRTTRNRQAQWVFRAGLLVAGAVLLGCWSVASAQSIGTSAASAAQIARDAARNAEQVAANQINAEARQRAGAMINNLRAKLDACGEDGMLGLHNTARTVIPPRPLLRHNPALELAASNHAIAMARQQFFDHTDPQGRTVGQRVKQIGYHWRVVGENLAAGQQTVGDTVQSWLLSRSHCNILIDPRFTEFGIARVNATNPADPYGSYWTLVLAQPR